jgi:hypothetical protein
MTPRSDVIARKHLTARSTPLCPQCGELSVNVSRLAGRHNTTRSGNYLAGQLSYSRKLLPNWTEFSADGRRLATASDDGNVGVNGIGAI